MLVVGAVVLVVELAVVGAALVGVAIVESLTVVVVVVGTVVLSPMDVPTAVASRTTANIPRRVPEHSMVMLRAGRTIRK